MPKLLIQTEDGRIYSAYVAAHFMVAEIHNIDMETIIACGFVTRGREVWTNRSPH